MFKDITIGQYYPTGSYVHELDPRTKILVTFALIAGLFIINTFIPYVYIVAFILGVVFISQIPLKYILKGLKPLRIIIIFTFLVNVFMSQGDIILSIGPLNATREGVYRAIFMAFRLILLVVGTSLLTLTTSPISLTDGIEQLLNP
ncbi:MAG: energy-coupling factor transporter transmembrane protein EcfT, partial [Alkaliphilus sp.]|nr:energy-coupling factor transporter transmembrane protein EcfT [Alkaliphilus sp.]